MKKPPFFIRRGGRINGHAQLRGAQRRSNPYLYA